eukprot:s366_g51.t1
MESGPDNSGIGIVVSRYRGKDSSRGSRADVRDTGGDSDSRRRQPPDTAALPAKKKEKSPPPSPSERRRRRRDEPDRERQPASLPARRRREGAASSQSSREPSPTARPSRPHDDDDNDPSSRRWRRRSDRAEVDLNLRPRSAHLRITVPSRNAPPEPPPPRPRGQRAAGTAQSRPTGILAELLARTERSTIRRSKQLARLLGVGRPGVDAQRLAY